MAAISGVACGIPASDVYFAIVAVRADAARGVFTTTNETGVAGRPVAGDDDEEV